MDLSDYKYVKLEILAPLDSVDRILSAIFAAGAGKFGNYDHVYTTSRVEGHWRPLPGSNPAIGSTDKDETASELKIEVNCYREIAVNVKNAILAVHPYEEPVINIILLSNAEIEAL